MDAEHVIYLTKRRPVYYRQPNVVSVLKKNINETITTTDGRNNMINTNNLSSYESKVIFLADW